MTDEKLALIVVWTFNLLGAVLVVSLLSSIYQRHLSFQSKHGATKRIKQNDGDQSLFINLYALKMIQEMGND